MDASLLLLAIVGFLPPTDPRIVGTVRAIETRLLVGGFIFRYDTNQTEDGLPPGEAAFLACSFWFVDNLILQGRVDEARAMFERLLALRNESLRRSTIPRRVARWGMFRRHSATWRSSTRRTISPATRARSKNAPVRTMLRCTESQNGYIDDALRWISWA
jgi:hypothetical protein